MVVTVSTETPRSCKALALLEGADQWLKIRRKSDGVKFYVIPGSEGHVYWTNCAECSCPDAQHRGVECKHIVAVKLYVAKVQAERPAKRSRGLQDGGAAHLAVQRASGEWPAASIMGVEKSFVPSEVAAKADLARQIWGTDDE
jgi:hypothetical protein